MRISNDRRSSASANDSPQVQATSHFFQRIQHSVSSAFHHFTSFFSFQGRQQRPVQVQQLSMTIEPSEDSFESLKQRWVDLIGSDERIIVLTGESIEGIKRGILYASDEKLSIYLEKNGSLDDILKLLTDFYDPNIRKPLSNPYTTYVEPFYNKNHLLDCALRYRDEKRLPPFNCYQKPWGDHKFC
jgi:hypothetical protein